MIHVLSHKRWRQGATTVGHFTTQQKAADFRDALIEFNPELYIGDFVIFEEQLDPENYTAVYL